MKSSTWGLIGVIASGVCAAIGLCKERAKSGETAELITETINRRVDVRMKELSDSLMSDDVDIVDCDYEIIE